MQWLWVSISIGLAGLLAVLLLHKNLFHILLAFLGVMLIVCILFVLNGADFMALIQLLLGAGGILIVLIFGLILTRTYETYFPISERKNLLWAGILCVALGYVIFRTGLITWEMPTLPSQFWALHQIGFQILTEHVLSFELLSIFLLLGLIAVSWILRKDAHS